MLNYKETMDNKTFDPTKYGMIICKHCNGRGYVEPKPYPDRQACPNCGGFGLVEEGNEVPAKTEGGTE